MHLKQHIYAVLITCPVYICRTAGLSVSTLTYITEFYSHRHRVLFVTLAVSGYPLSRVYKAAVAYIWLPYKFSLTIVAGEFELTAWRFFVLISVPMLLFLIGSSFWLPPGPQFEMLMGRKEKTLQVLRRMYVKNTRQAPDVCNAPAAMFIVCVHFTT